MLGGVEFILPGPFGAVDEVDTSSREFLVQPTSGRDPDRAVA
jgi:hypothetical protein